MLRKVEELAFKLVMVAAVAGGAWTAIKLAAFYGTL